MNIINRDINHKGQCLLLFTCHEILFRFHLNQLYMINLLAGSIQEEVTDLFVTQKWIQKWIFIRYRLVSNHVNVPICIAS